MNECHSENLFGQGPEGYLSFLQKERDDAAQSVLELREQIAAMDSAARLLLRVVAIPVNCDDDNILTTKSGCSVDGAKKRDSSRRNEVTGLIDLDEEKVFDELQKTWKFEQTGFPTLFNACKMLKESRHLLAQEADHALDEMRLAQEAANASEKKLTNMKRALRKIYKENQDLRRENAKIKETLREVSQEKNKELDEVYAMLAHQEVLSPPRNRSLDSTKNASHPTRFARHGASKSFDASMDPAFDASEACTASPVLSLSAVPLSPLIREFNENEHPVLASPLGITNESATVHFKDATPGVGDLIAMWMNKDQNRDTYKITYSNSADIGLKLHSMPIKPLAPDGSGGARTSSDELSRTSKLGRHVDVNKFLRKHPDAFIVWGFREVDTCLSEKRPTIGARLVAVNGSSVERGQWGTLNELCRRVRTKKGPVTLTFRNDLVTKEQIDHLNRTLTPRVEEKQVVGRSTTVCFTKTPERRRPLNVLIPNLQ